MEVCNGVLRIIDYKTGLVNKSNLEVYDWELLHKDYDYSKAFQLLCYSLMYHQLEPFEQLEAGIVSFKNLKAGFIPFGQKAEKGSRNKKYGVDLSVLEQFKNVLNQLIMEICDPEIPFEAKEV